MKIKAMFRCPFAAKANSHDLYIMKFPMEHGLLQQFPPENSSKYIGLRSTGATFRHIGIIILLHL